VLFALHIPSNPIRILNILVEQGSVNLGACFIVLLFFLLLFFCFSFFFLWFFLTQNLDMELGLMQSMTMLQTSSRHTAEPSSCLRPYHHKVSNITQVHEKPERDPSPATAYPTCSRRRAPGPQYFKWRHFLSRCKYDKRTSACRRRLHFLNIRDLHAQPR